LIKNTKIYENTPLYPVNLLRIVTANNSFSLQLEEISSNDSLIFAYLGYEKTVFSCAELLTNSKQKIYLRKETYQLPKVELVSKSLTKYKKIGHPRTTSKNITAGWLSTPTKNYQRPLGERGTLVKLKNKQALLKTLYFHIVNTGYDSLLFRIHLYKFENGIPKKEITKTNIWAKTTEKKGWVTVPLETYNILVEEDFVASIEWIKAWTSKEKEKGSLVLSSGIIGGNLYARNYYHLASNWIKRKNFHIGIYIDAKTN